MRILFLTQILPYPPDAGPKVKTWHVLRYLAEKGHQITLVTFIRPEEIEYVKYLEEICESVHTVPIHRSTFANMRYWFQSRLTGRPFLVERDNLGSMHSLVQKLIHQENFDTLHADQLTMTQFALALNRGRVNYGVRPAASMEHLQKGGHGHDQLSNHLPAYVFDAHNAIWITVERMILTAPWYLKPVLANEVERLRRYTGRVVRSFDHTFTVTETDRKSLSGVADLSAHEAGANPLPITVIPIAVDTVKLAPIELRHGLTNILTLGSLHYPPNADGVRWFAVEVFPLIRKRIPNVTLTIVGKNPPEDFYRLAADSEGAIEVTGYVPDLRPYYEKAALVAVPVRAGGGMRVRILEAFALAMPVVTTTVGIEGIEARPDIDFMIGDSAPDFSDAVVRVLGDESLRIKLAANGRRLAETKYDWLVVLEKLDQLYESLNQTGEH